MPLLSSTSNSEADLVRTRRGRVMCGVFISTAALILLLHPPSNLASFVAAVFVPLFDVMGYPRQVRADTRATDLQLQLFTRSLSAAFLCLAAPRLDANHNARLLTLISNMITDTERPTAFFLYTSALLTFFTFVSVRVAHAKLEPYVFCTASVLASVPPVVVNFAMQHVPSMLEEREAISNDTLVSVAVLRHGVDVILIFVLLATVHHITVSTIPRYGSDITGRVGDEEAGNLVEGDDDDDDDDDRDRVDSSDGTRLIVVD